MNYLHSYHKVTDTGKTKEPKVLSSTGNGDIISSGGLLG